MDRTSYDKAKSLLYVIDDLSASADNISELLNEIKTNGGKAKFVVCTKNGTSTTELAKTSSEKICEELLENYFDLIRKTKDELNNVIESTIVDKAVVD